MKKHKRIALHDVEIGAVIDWLRSSPRKPSHLAFSAGPKRQLADEIELAIHRTVAGLESKNRELDSTVELLRADLDAIDAQRGR